VHETETISLFRESPESSKLALTRSDFITLNQLPALLSETDPSTIYLNYVVIDDFQQLKYLSVILSFAFRLPLPYNSIKNLPRMTDETPQQYSVMSFQIEKKPIRDKGQLPVFACHMA
jgi:hypothetical protein